MARRLRRECARLLHAFSLQRRWRTDLQTWAGEHLPDVLQSRRGDAHVIETVRELATRLAPVFTRLDEGPAVLSDHNFAASFQHALSWLAYQEDITARGATLRAYCDITATVAVVERLVAAMAREMASTHIADDIDVALTLAATTGNWREPLIMAGRRRLAAGRYDDAIECGRRALNIVSGCPESQRLLMDALRERRRTGGPVDRLAEAGLADLRGRFCPRPFEVLVSSQTTRWSSETDTCEQVMGASYLCDCAAWLPFIAGNVVEADTPDDVWNSPGAQEIRRSILDGDYTYCSRTLCPSITNDALPRREAVSAPRLRRIIDQHETLLTDGPQFISLGHDSSCNLACPSCRVELVMANPSQNEQLDRARDRVILPLLRHRRVGVNIAAWGDPFASRHYRSILEALSHADFDEVGLHVLTNGLALTKNVWTAMPHLAGKIVELRVSVDAATQGTYENVRRPGRWALLLENLRAIGEISQTGVFRRNRARQDAESIIASDACLGAGAPVSFALAFVVQSANFREMPAFVRLAEDVNADSVVFQRYYSFGHEGSQAFGAKDVAAPGHPEHQELQAILADPLLKSPRVLRIFLTQLIDQPSA